MKKEKPSSLIHNLFTSDEFSWCWFLPSALLPEKFNKLLLKLVTQDVGEEAGTTCDQEGLELAWYSSSTAP